VISVNLTGQFLCVPAAIVEFLPRARPEVSSSSGKIIRMSSVHQELPWAGHCNGRHHDAHEKHRSGICTALPMLTKLSAMTLKPSQRRMPT
jgi:NAD(P)-dependent dehydrogenase (short-subunit alcohol dehydrogenase family)